MLFWLPSSSWGSFLFNSYWKLMPNTLLATLLLLWWFLIQFLLKTDAKCSSGYPPPLVVVSYSILIENWCQILFWLPSSSCGGFLFSSYWKLMPNALLATLLLLWWFLIQFLLKTDAKCSSGYPPPLVVVSYSILIGNWCQMLFLATVLLLWWFLIQFLLKTDAKCSSGYPPPLVVVSYSILIENWCQMLFWLPSSSCGGFLFNSYWKLMPNTLLATSSSCGGFLFNSYWKLMPNALLATLLLLWWFLIQFLLKTDAKYSSGYPPPLVVVSYSILIKNWCQILFWLPSSSCGGFSSSPPNSSPRFPSPVPSLVPLPSSASQCNTRTHTQTHSRARTHAHVRTHTRTRTLPHTYARTHTHTHTRTHTYARTRTYTYARTHAPARSLAHARFSGALRSTATYNIVLMPFRRRGPSTMLRSPTHACFSSALRPTATYIIVLMPFSRRGPSTMLRIVLCVRRREP